MELIMKNKVTIYLPTDNKSWVRKYAYQLSENFGGCTVTPHCTGYWIDTKGELIEDKITLLSSFIADDWDINHKGIESWSLIARNIAEDIRVKFNQDCVSLEINGELYFI
jgi:hypothetical protein